MSPEPMPASQSVNTSSAAAPQSFFNRLIGVYFSPGETFQEIGRAPRVLVPIIVMMVVGAVVGYLMIDRIGVRNFFGQQFNQAVASGQMTQEQANQQLEVMSSGTVGTITKASFPLVGAVQGLIFALIVAGVFKLISMVMGFENDFKPLLAVTLYTLVAISLISSLLMVILLYLKSPEEIDVQNLVGSNLNALLVTAVGKDGLPAFIMAFARWIDLFAIWILILLSIGYAAVSRRLKVSTVAITLGGLYVVIALLFSAVAAVRG
jgi:hypothetical protein